MKRFLKHGKTLVNQRARLDNARVRAKMGGAAEALSLHAKNSNSRYFCRSVPKN
jgi:hypothetical protein